MQSNFGVVVKMGVWLMPFPEVVRADLADRPATETDLIPLIDTVRRLRLDRTLEGVPRLYNTTAVRIADGGADPLVRRGRRDAGPRSSTRSPAIWGSAAG